MRGNGNTIHSASWNIYIYMSKSSSFRWISRLRHPRNRESAVLSKDKHIAQERSALLDLPTELILQILADVPPSSLLAFALVCRSFCDIALDVLYNIVVVTPPHEMAFRVRTAKNDPLFTFVNHVRVGQLPYKSAGRSCILPLSSLFRVSPHLHNVEVICWVRLDGWDSVLKLGALALSLREVSGVMHLSPPTKSRIQVCHLLLHPDSAHLSALY